MTGGSRVTWAGRIKADAEVTSSICVATSTSDTSSPLSTGMVMATSMSRRPSLDTQMSSSGFNGINGARSPHWYRDAETDGLRFPHGVRKRKNKTQLPHGLRSMLVDVKT